MDKRISPQDLAVLDRRQLLRGAAAATAIRALPASEPAVAAPQEIEASANLAGWSHFSADTLRRLEKIALRNRLRKEAGLPLLSVVKELRHMKTVEDGERFNQFVALHKKGGLEPGPQIHSRRHGRPELEPKLDHRHGNSSERVGNSQATL